MRSLLVFIFFIFALFSCKENSVESIKIPDENIENNKITDYVKINDTISILFDSKIKILSYQTDIGQVKSYQNEIKYYAPSIPDIATIKYCLEKQDGYIFVDSIKLGVYNQLVLLKADDLVYDNKTNISAKWVKFINLICKKKIKASIGLIANSIENGNSKYIDILKSLSHNNNFEIWNHGYDHTVQKVNENGVVYNEFKNSPYEYQLEHLRKAQDLVKEKIGYVMHTFGAPGNGIDNNTILALEQFEEIKVWYFGIEGSSKLVIKRNGEIEYPVLNPVFNDFVQKYNPQLEYIALQIHPNAWDDKKFEEFNKITDYLINNKATFINPNEYHLYLENLAINGKRFVVNY